MKQYKPDNFENQNVVDYMFLFDGEKKTTDLDYHYIPQEITITFTIDLNFSFQLQTKWMALFGEIYANQHRQ